MPPANVSGCDVLATPIRRRHPEERRAGSRTEWRGRTVDFPGRLPEASADLAAEVRRLHQEGEGGRLRRRRGGRAHCRCNSFSLQT